jgi:pSer/pThr/pTyr-binding forkhead associated (FHA) protein
MAKFTVLFKERPIQSTIFDTRVIHIGSDDTNDLIIDSLAVAPAHAVVSLNDGHAVIKQLNDNFPLVINNEAHKECPLNNDDEIAIGKHKIIFNTVETVLTPPPPESLASKDLESLNEELEPDLNISEAYLQVMGGKHIGRLIPIKNGMTRIGHNGSGVAAIAKRTDGYYISSLENDDLLTVNKKPLEEQTIKLNKDDQIFIDNTPMQFFLD